MRTDWQMMLAVTALRMSLRHLTAIRRSLRGTASRDVEIWLSGEIRRLAEVYLRLKRERLCAPLQETDD